MKKFLALLSLLQLTKDQPLSGYLLGGVPLSETATLAEHHYTAALMGWLITEKIRSGGGNISERKVVLMLLIHDLSELFGGDIASPLNRKYPDLRKYKNLIGDVSIDLLVSYLDAGGRASFLALWKELEAGETDEAIVAKIIDQMDHQFFLEHRHYHQVMGTAADDHRPPYLRKHVYPLAARLRDPQTKKIMEEFFASFEEHVFNRGYRGLAILMEDNSSD